MTFENSLKIGSKNWIVVFALLLISLVTVNPFCTFSALVVLLFLYKLLYRRNEPPVFMLALALQWLQVTVKVFYADFFELPLQRVVTYPDNIYAAYFLSLAGLVILSIGVWIPLSKVRALEKEDYQRVAKRFDIRKLCGLYIFCIIAYPFLIKFGNSTRGLQQFFQNFGDIKWSLLFLFYIVTQLKNQYKSVFYIILLGEVIMSFTGFFSSFKEYFILLAVGYLMLNQSIKRKQAFWIGLSGVLLFNIFVIWQHVKPEYRKFLNKGEASQEVKVGSGDAFGKLTDLVSKMDTAGYRDGVERLIDRTSYIDFFSASISYVPRYTAHENGKLWKGAVLHVFTPRILFPDKPAIDDSRLTSKYTGVELAGADKGTSISLGYVGESYVDLGNVLMFVPLFLFGLCIGLIYRYLLTQTFHVLWGLALIIPLLFHLNVFEAALIKLVGGLIAYFIVIYILVKVRFIHRLDKYIVQDETSSRQAPVSKAVSLRL